MSVMSARESVQLYNAHVDAMVSDRGAYAAWSGSIYRHGCTHSYRLVLRATKLCEQYVQLWFTVVNTTPSTEFTVIQCPFRIRINYTDEALALYCVRRLPPQRHAAHFTTNRNAHRLTVHYDSDTEAPDHVRIETVCLTLETLSLGEYLQRRHDDAAARVRSGT